MTASGTEYVTENLALVGWLEYCGHDSLDAKLGVGQQTCWTFETSSQLASLVQAFFDGKARVEPKRYTQVMAEVRREMNVLRYGDQRRQ